MPLKQNYADLRESGYKKVAVFQKLEALLADCVALKKIFHGRKHRFLPEKTPFSPIENFLKPSLPDGKRRLLSENRGLKNDKMEGYSENIRENPWKVSIFFLLLQRYK